MNQSSMAGFCQRKERRSREPRNPTSLVRWMIRMRHFKVSFPSSFVFSEGRSSRTVTGNNADSARPFVHWWRGAHSSSIEPVGMSVTIEKPAGVIPPPWLASSQVALMPSATCEHCFSPRTHRHVCHGWGRGALSGSPSITVESARLKQSPLSAAREPFKWLNSQPR